MNETRFSIKDVQKFLYEHGILWDGTNKNEKSIDDLLLVDVVLFGEKGISDKKEVLLNIKGCTFEIFTEDCSIVYQETHYTRNLYQDLSLDWTKNLLEKDPSIAQSLKTEVEYQMNEIHMNTANEIKPLQNKIDRLKEKEASDLAPLNEIREAIMSSLSKSPTSKSPTHELKL